MIMEENVKAFLVSLEPQESLIYCKVHFSKIKDFISSQSGADLRFMNVFLGSPDKIVSYNLLEFVPLLIVPCC